MSQFMVYFHGKDKKESNSTLKKTKSIVIKEEPSNFLWLR